MGKVCLFLFHFSFLCFLILLRSVEVVKGQYTFTNYDVLSKNLGMYGVTPYYILDYSNQFYDGGLSPYDEAGIISFSLVTCFFI